MTYPVSVEQLIYHSFFFRNLLAPPNTTRLTYSIFQKSIFYIQQSLRDINKLYDEHIYEMAKGYTGFNDFIN